MVFRLPGREEVALLNPSAYEIWLLCDGWRTQEEIAEHLADRYQLSADELRSDVEDAIARTEALGLIEGPRTKSRSVTLTLQTENDTRGFFAILHSVWSALYMVGSEYAKRVTLLDGEDDYWETLFEPTTDLLTPGAENIELKPLRADLLIEQFPELVREDYTLDVLPHHLATWPKGRVFAERLGNRNARRRMHRVYSSLIRPRRWILDEVEAFCRAGIGDHPTIGLHLRSTRHLGVVMEAQQFVDDVVGPAVERIVAREGLDDYRVFVASHVGDYIRHCRRKFGDRLIERDIKRDPDPATDFLLLDATRSESARDVLVDCLILSRCNFVVGVPSNVLLASLIFNPENDLEIFDYAMDLRESLEFFPTRP